MDTDRTFVTKEDIPEYLKREIIADAEELRKLENAHKGLIQGAQAIMETALKEVDDMFEMQTRVTRSLAIFHFVMTVLNAVMLWLNLQ